MGSLNFWDVYSTILVILVYRNRCNYIQRYENKIMQSGLHYIHRTFILSYIGIVGFIGRKVDVCKLCFKELSHLISYHFWFLIYKSFKKII